MKNINKRVLLLIILWALCGIFLIVEKANAEIVNSEHLPWLQDRCAIYNVPMEIVLAVAIVESGFKMVISKPNSNNSFDVGIMQLNSRYLNYYAKTFWYKDRVFDANEPKDNIEMGILILKNLYRQTGNWDLAVQAYNVGCSKLKQDPESGKSYLVKVINVLNTLELRKM